MQFQYILQDQGYIYTGSGNGGKIIPTGVSGSIGQYSGSIMVTVGGVNGSSRSVPPGVNVTGVSSGVVYSGLSGIGRIRLQMTVTCMVAVSVNASSLSRMV